ncbi:MAG TPA: methyltransferase domain-containing protein [Bacillota bacterium]|nr:methyltransferase domain-containing protein [Bacillota bacterium]
MSNINGLLLNSCPICESRRLQCIFVSRGYPVSLCRDCGFTFLNRQPSDRVLAEIYNSDYFLGEPTPQGEKAISDMKRASAELNLQMLIEYCGKSTGRLLEIGCGKGDFLAVARKAGFDVTGIEISRHAADRANRLLGGACVRCGTPETALLPGEQYDVCVAFDTIEHVRDPLQLLKIVHQILKPGGVLFLSTPSLDSWPARLMRRNWMEFKTEHLHYFDRQTIQNALAKSGFAEVLITPGYKYLTMDYIFNHFDKYKVPFFTPLTSLLRRLTPASIRSRQFKIAAGGINVLCRAAHLREKPVISIVVPVYNERDTFPVLMDSLLEKELPGLDKEIIVVESNSDDGTREKALSYQNKPGVKLVLEHRPRGKGHAVRNGFKHMTGDFVMIQDGDLEYDLNDYGQLIDPLQNYRRALVLGSRHSKGWKMRRFTDQPALALLMNCGQMLFAGLLNLSLGQRLKDPFTMFKVFRRDCLYGLTFEADRFDFDFELIIKLLRKGYRPLEVPVNYRSRSFREGKKVSLVRDPLLWLRALLKYRFEPLYGEYRRTEGGKKKDE